MFAESCNARKDYHRCRRYQVSFPCRKFFGKEIIYSKKHKCSQYSRECMTQIRQRDGYRDI